MRVSLLTLAWILLSPLTAPAANVSAPLDAEQIGNLVGTHATTTPDGVVRVGWARNDVPVQVDGLPLKPFLGLGTWAAIQGNQEAAMLMGDTVLFEDEVNPAIDAALASDLEITALHNHFFFDHPRVYFMHLGGEGDPKQLAAGVRRVWEAARQVRKEHPQPATSFGGELPKPGVLHREPLEQLLGAKGELQDGMLKITLGRESEMNGVPFGGSMGLTTWFGFAGSDELAVVDGDFAMTAVEVPAVLRALRHAHINVLALHNHMLGEKPVIYFTHFWGKGPATELAGGLHQALEAQKRAHP